MRRLVVGILSYLVVSSNAGTALAQQPPRSSCLSIVYDVATQCVRDKDGSGPEPATEERSEAKVVLTLSARACAWQSEGALSTWDFEACVGRTIDRAAGTYSEVSLLHEAGFVQAEMLNRQKLREALSAGKVELGAEWAPFDLSVLFCWPAKGDDVRLERVEEGGEVRFRRGEDVVSSWRPSEHALDEPQRGLFARLLQRRAHLHPQVLEALAASGRLPAELVFRWRDPGSRTTTTWRLTGVATVDEWPGSVDKLQRSFGDGPLGRIARMVSSPDAEGVPDRVSTERFAELAEAARKNGRFADAAMLLMESSLSTGAEIPQMRELVADAAAKQQIMAFMRPITLANSEPEKALELFGALDRSQLSRPAFLDVFRVTALSRQGKVRDALDLMLATLEVSPWIAMAYKDLGDLYYASFETAQAWTAWELGRRVAPAHGCWKEVAAHEGRLRREFAGRL